MTHISKFPSGVILTPSASAETLIVNGWFAETEAMWPGQKLCIQVEEVLLNGRSDFQDILVFKSKTYGTVLVLGKHQMALITDIHFELMSDHTPLSKPYQMVSSKLLRGMNSHTKR